MMTACVLCTALEPHVAVALPDTSRQMPCRLERGLLSHHHHHAVGVFQLPVVKDTCVLQVRQFSSRCAVVMHQPGPSISSILRGLLCVGPSSRYV